MKRTKKQVLSLVTVGYLLVNTVVMSGAVFAETVPSEEVKTTSKSSPTSESLSSSLPDIPAPAISSSEPTVSSEAKKAARILSYEDNQLLEVTKADSATPAIVFQKKELENGLTIQGTVSAGRKENQSDTILSALILQRQAESGEWEEVHPFSINEDGIDLTENEFAFEYSEGVEKTGDVRYRLAADYSIKYSDDEQTQKGSLEIGTITKTEKKESQEQTEESIPATQESSEAVQESTTESTQESSGLTEQSTVESSGPKEDSKQDDPTVFDSSAITGITNPTTLSENNQIPKMQETYREAFQRGLGIMPLASPILKKDVNYTFNTTFSSSQPKVTSNVPEVYEAIYTSKTTVKITFKWYWSFLAYSRNNAPNGDYTSYADTKGYDFEVRFVNDVFSSKDGGYSITGDLVNGKLFKQQGSEFAIPTISNDRKVWQLWENTNDVRIWSSNTTFLTFDNISVAEARDVGFGLTAGTLDGGLTSQNSRLTLGTNSLVDLTNISTPKIVASDGVTTSVNLKQGTYSGDISDVISDGTFWIMKKSGGSFEKLVTNLNHTTSTNGTYGGPNGVGDRVVGSLLPGSLYRGQVRLKDSYGVEKFSIGNAEFYTPNSLTSPTMELGEPTKQNDASVKFTSTYGVGDQPAHPHTVEIEMYDFGSNEYRPISVWPSITPKTTINQATKTVSYELSGLPSNNQVKTRFRVKNGADNNNFTNAWSSWVESDFNTKGVSLVVNDPPIDHDATSHNQIVLKSGTYTGHTSKNASLANKGSVWYRTGTRSIVYPTQNLPFDTTLNGTYNKNGLVISGLDTGTTYQIRASLPDSSDQWSHADFMAYTLNTVSKPVVESLPTPIGKYNASANISGVYGIGPSDTTPAHPDKVQVRVSLDNSTWKEIDGSTTPQLDSQSIDESSTKANFTINKLKASTHYYVQYKVKNLGGWSEWSASEEFTTLAGPPSMELINAPKFDFGMLKNENFPQTATLDAASTKNHVELENTILASGWKLTAKLDQLKRTDNPSIVMPWATLSLDINLQKSPDDGVSWSNYATGVIGSPRIVSINSGAAAVPLWSISDPQYSQGLFRTEIDWSSVQLDVPANQIGMYQGNLVWSLDDTP